MYYPETRGLSVSGQVVRSQDRQAEAYSSIYVTLLGTDPDCLGFMTDESGRIHFSIPRHTDSRDILITFDPRKDEELEIIMDDEYSDDYADVPDPSDKFLTDSRILVEEVMVNNQLGRVFKSADRETTPADESGAGQPFYGSPDLRYRTDDYVALPNLEEFCFNLIPSLYLQKDKDKRYFIIRGVTENGRIMQNTCEFSVEKGETF